MLKTLKLQNFAQHVDRVVEFTPGLNAIRGANRIGKSQILRAISYALFGAAGLDKPFDRVVTRGVAPSKLRVDLDFSLLGIEYHVYRAKSGAELTWPGGRVTGQDAVTKEIERLFGADAKMAGQLMIANQKKMAGEMTKGSVGAARLIEALADFDLLDRIKDLIQTKLPSGGTSSVEGRIALLTEQTAEVELTPLAPLEAALAGADDAVEASQAALSALRQREADLAQKDPADVLHRLMLARDQHGRLETTVLALRERAALPEPKAPTDKEMAKLRAAHEASKQVTAALVLNCDLQAADTRMLWDEPREALDEAIVANEAKAVLDEAALKVATERWNNLNTMAGATQRANDQALQTLHLSVAKVEGRLVKEGACAFCQKDLTDVPEVALLNSALGRELAALRAQITLHETQAAEAASAAQGDINDAAEAMTALAGTIHDARAELAELRKVVKVADALEPLYARAAPHIELDRSVVPAQWKWIGPTSGSTDAAEALFAAEKLRTALETFRGAAAETARQLAAAETDLAGLAAGVAALAPQEEQATADLAALRAVKQDISAAVDQAMALGAARLAAFQALSQAQHRNESLVVQRELAVAQLAAAHADLLEMQANNLLIKKVAAARPQITDKIWGMVLGATSGYLTSMLGEPSAVTRDNGEFLINGAPAADASGAEEDCFGLSIRASLTRTFIPTAPFLMLDEPAAACDEARETAMLAQIASLGFDQTILITHSDLCESFANNLIVIE